ncbi:MAG: erythromycin esterase family protein, partial [Chloroflexota bacterium]
DTDYFNIRDRAMADHVIAFAEELFPEERFVLWAHNGHVAESADDVTPMGHNLHNHFGDDYLSVGFAFKNGDFNAISFIDGEYGALRSMTVLPLIEGSHETIFASADIPRYILDLRVEEGTLAHAWLSESYYFRYIGALYNPSAETEEFTYPTVLYGTFDLMIYFEDTSPSVLL